MNLVLRLKSITLLLALTVILVFNSSAAAQTDRPQISYTVAVKSTAERLFHVTTEVKNLKQPQLILSLPTWTPGWYTVENYAKNVLRFTVADAKGSRLPQMMTRKQTWRIDTAGLNQVRIEFDYKADVLALNQARIGDDLAFFTGTQLFLQVEGQRSASSTVRFVTPPGWKLVSALKETSDPSVFLAPDYDALVDSPTLMGTFDLTEFQVDGKPHLLATYPAGRFSQDNAGKFTRILSRIAQVQSQIFGGLPYDKYLYVYFFTNAESNAGGALEHANSHVTFAGSGPFATPENLSGVASHEYFHLWNVKRLRPVEMWPYDYSRENESPLLWVSEGFTNYYGAIANYRAGHMTRDGFLASVAGAITGVENSEARNYISPADSSTSTWLGYDTPVAFGISYYTQGQNLAALLDLSILHDTEGKAGLDSVMASLYREFYLKGRGFSMEDVIATIRSVTKRDYRDFFRNYVWGVAVPRYDEILGYAGYRADKTSRQVPRLGISATNSPEGIKISHVQSGSPAESGGLKAGDVVVKVDGGDPRQGFSLMDKIGKSVTFTVKRDGAEIDVPVTVAAQADSSFRLVSVDQPTPEQLRIRESWLRLAK